ncbi:MAG TPA: response regulator [Burkholderiales bacterium]|nr:response regulator [Burkholderiales bacterium]
MGNTPDSGCTVFIVDDDQPMRDSLALMLGLLGYRAASFASAEAFLSAYRRDWTGCVVADLKLPGKSGLELQAEVRKLGSQLPFVIITAHGGVSSARAAFQADAVDFIEKPFDEADLRAAIEKGLEREMGRVRRAAAIREETLSLDRLTRREREVLELAGKGLHAKEIAHKLGISPRTVELHKASLMDKLGARNVAELVRFALAADKPRE